MMELEPELLWIDARTIADEIVFRWMGQHLSDIEIKVLQASWEGKTYDGMATFYGYSTEYLNKDVGNKLWKKLSNAIGEPVTKKNFKEALRRYQKHQHQTEHSQTETMPAIAETSVIVTDIPYPEGFVKPDSPLYLERTGVESVCDETVLKPGSLIRIKAPRLMGKTSLLIRLFDYATKSVTHRF
jgi:hypothetical protein